MGRRRKAKPADPLVIAQRRAAERDPANWGLDRAALDLPANAEVEAKSAPGHGRRARRRDVFDRLLAGPALEAVRRLQRDLSIAHALAGGVATYAERIDHGPREDPMLDARLRAGERTRRALALCGPASARLLKALCEGEAALGRPADWRTLVERESGERLADAQGAVLRAACKNLAGAYAALDRRPRTVNNGN
jgi:hypothetical protein